MPALNKPLAELTRDDLEALITSDWPENETLEYKQTLAHSSAGKQDKWLVDQSEIGVSGKRDILSEVVAMANSYGGDVILGIEEADEKPPRAIALHPVPACIDLASRLEHAARDLIHPQIPMLGVRGIPISGTSGAVVFRVPKSRNAPHRLEIKGMEKECYKRVSDRTEAMTMREIQDLTFSAARGIDHVNVKLAKYRDEFERWGRAPENVRWMSFAVVATPLSSDIFIERVHRNSAVIGSSRAFTVKASDRAQPENLPVIREAYDWRPILRGTQAMLDGRYANLRRLTCEGDILEFVRITAPIEDHPQQQSEYVFYCGWLFLAVLNCFEVIQKVRVAAAASAVQFALAIAVLASNPLPVMTFNAGSRSRSNAAFGQGLTNFPHYEVGEFDSWQDTFGLIWRDFFSAAGIDAQNDDPRVEGW